MINLKKLAMISAMGMALSTSALATDGDATVGLTVESAPISAETPAITNALDAVQIGGSIDGDGTNVLELKYIFKANNEDAQNVTFALPTSNDGKLTLSHTDASGDTHTIVIPMAVGNANGDANPSKIAAGDTATEFFVHSSGDSDAITAEGSYSGDYVVSLVY